MLSDMGWNVARVIEDYSIRFSIVEIPAPCRPAILAKARILTHSVAVLSGRCQPEVALGASTQQVALDGGDGNAEFGRNFGLGHTIKLSI